MSGVLERAYIRRVSRTRKRFEEAAKKAWTKETAYPPDQERWSAENPAIGQCVVTTVYINKRFGGEILYYPLIKHAENFTPFLWPDDWTKSQFPKGTTYGEGVFISAEELLSSSNARTAERYALFERNMDREFKPGIDIYPLIVYSNPIEVFNRIKYGKLREVAERIFDDIFPNATEYRGSAPPPSGYTKDVTPEVHYNAPRRLLVHRTDDIDPQITTRIERLPGGGLEVSEEVTQTKKGSRHTFERRGQFSNLVYTRSGIKPSSVKKRAWGYRGEERSVEYYDQRNSVSKSALRRMTASLQQRSEVLPA